jgi:hypothetical protein
MVGFADPSARILSERTDPTLVEDAAPHIVGTTLTDS